MRRCFTSFSMTGAVDRGEAQAVLREVPQLPWSPVPREVATMVLEQRGRSICDNAREQGGRRRLCQVRAILVPGGKC